MRPVPTRSVLILSLVVLVAGCSGGSSSSSGNTVAPATSANNAPTTSSTPAPPTSSAPSGLTGTPGEFQLTYGGRDYVLYVPDGYSPTTPLPLVVCFHGSGDTATNFWNTLRTAGWDAAARSEQTILLVPDTKSPLSSFPVWSGNPNNDVPQMQTELDDVLALVRDDVATRYALAGTHGLGFSDGGLFLAAVGLAHPELSTCTILGYGWGGFYVTTPTTPRPVHMACGDADSFFAGAQQSQAFLRSQGHEVLWEPVTGVGHSMIGLSAAIDPAAALAWIVARTPGASAGSPPATGGSGGTGGALGLSTRSVTTQAQAGLPPVTVSYDLYVPSTYVSGTPTPMLFAANMGLTPWRALAEQEGVIAVDFRDHDRNGGFTYGYDVLLLQAILQDVEGAYNVDTKRRYYHGFSAGAHWGYTVVLANADVFAALGINAGSMSSAIQQGVWPNGVPRRIPVLIRHGTNDAVVPIQAGRADRDRLQNAGHPVQLSEFTGGHTISAQDAQVVWAYLKQHRLP